MITAMFPKSVNDSWIYWSATSDIAIGLRKNKMKNANPIPIQKHQMARQADDCGGNFPHFTGHYFLVLAAITGLEWVLAGQYLKFSLIFGGSALSIFLVWLTRSPLFMVTTCAIALAGVLWH